MAIKAPNYTQTPNILFTLIPEMSNAELRVTFVIVRATFGWQQGGNAASLSVRELMKRAGLSRQGVLDGLKAGIERGTIFKIPGSRSIAAAYGLVVSSVDHPDAEGGLTTRPEVFYPLDHPGLTARPQLVYPLDHQNPLLTSPSAKKSAPKEKLKKYTKERERKGAAHAADFSLSKEGKNQSAALHPSTPIGQIAQIDGENLATEAEVVPGAAGGAPAARSGQRTSRPIAAHQTAPGGPANPDPRSEPTPGAGQASERLGASAAETAWAQVLIDLWNEHRGPLPEAQGMSVGRIKAAGHLLRDCQFDQAQARLVMEHATREVAADEFWLKHRYGLDSLLPAKVLARAEAWRSRLPSLPSSQDFRVGQRVIYLHQSYEIEGITGNQLQLFDEENGSCLAHISAVKAV